MTHKVTAVMPGLFLFRVALLEMWESPLAWPRESHSLLEISFFAMWQSNAMCQSAFLRSSDAACKHSSMSGCSGGQDADDAGCACPIPLLTWHASLKFLPVCQRKQELPAQSAVYCTSPCWHWWRGHWWIPVKPMLSSWASISFFFFLSQMCKFRTIWPVFD